VIRGWLIIDLSDYWLLGKIKTKVFKTKLASDAYAYAKEFQN